jgi:hypothetical protein
MNFSNKRLKRDTFHTLLFILYKLRSIKTKNKDLPSGEPDGLLEAVRGKWDYIAGDQFRTVNPEVEKRLTFSTELLSKDSRGGFYVLYFI